MKTNNSEYKIEKGIPIPHRGGFLSEVVIKMEVGDSILVNKRVSWITASLAPLRHSKGIKVTCRTQKDGSVRVWRIA